MNASPADQRRLLDLADLDARIRSAEQLRQNPPQAQRVRELLTQRQELSAELAQRLGVRDDLRVQIERLEADVALVDARVQRDRERLASSSSPREIEGFESELASLARRKSDLEDVELDLMEKLEVAEAAVAEQEQLIATTNAEGAELSAAGKQAVAEATAAAEAAARDRAAVVSTLPGPLVTMYERAAKGADVGAALLRRGMCEGCRMVLAGTDLQSARDAADDTVITCPECGCILVRTEESGL